MRIICSLVLLLMSLSAQAAVLTGNDFIAMCQKTGAEETYTEQCLGYVSGIYEAYISFNSWDLIADTLCPAEGTLVADMTTAAVNYISAMEEHEGKTASSMVLNAMADTYPCP